MLDSMSYTPTEVFANNLKYRLQNLDEPSSPSSSDDEQPSRPTNIAHIRALLMEPKDPLLFGTTFPPSKNILQQLQAPKYHSVTDLTKTQDLSSQSQQQQIYQDMSPETTQANIVDQTDDSDLFFDFDIESPHEEEIIENDKIIDIKQIKNPMCQDDRRSSESSLESDTMTGASTTFGSTSSGLYSDTDSKTNEDLLDGGLSIDPEAWMKNPGASLEDMLRMKQSGFREKNEDSTDDSSKESDVTIEDEDKTKICIGDTEKEVAHSKLSALISLLEQDRDHSSSNRRSSTVGKPSTSPDKSDPTRLSLQKPFEEQTIISTSPANFSFLKPSSNSEDENRKLCRSHSTSILADIKDFQKMKESVEVQINASSPMNKNQESKNETNVDDESKNNKYRRCSSLKSRKSPPGTPGRRKLVRFADVFGLDLADVKTFLDEVPKVPKSAFQDLKEAELSDLDSDSGSERTFPVQPPSKPPQQSSNMGVAMATPIFSPLFNQPSGSTDFFNKLRDKKVILESAYMSDITTIKGIVRVVNLDFHKSVFVRYTMDEWATTSDASSQYMTGSCDGFSDKFVFNIDISSIKGQVGRKIQFCVCFVCSNNQYWDNNTGKNYTFQCFGAPVVNPVSYAAIPRSTALPAYSAPQRSNLAPHLSTACSPSAISDDPWGRFL